MAADAKRCNPSLGTAGSRPVGRWEHWLQQPIPPAGARSARPRAFGMKTALVLSLLMMTTTGCVLPLRVVQTLMPPPRPEPDNTPYPKTVLRGIVPGQRIDWIGNDTVVFAGHPVQTRSQSWLYAWDMKTPPKKLLEGVTSFCVIGDRVGAAIRAPKGRKNLSLWITFPELKMQQRIQQKPTTKASYSSRYTCQVHQTPAPLVGHFWKELGGKEGYLDFGPLDGTSMGHVATRLDNNLTNRQDTGIRIDLPILMHITDWHPQPGYLLYDINLSPEERERWQRTNRLTIWHLDEQHRGHALNVPAGPWVNTQRGDILFLKARDGLVITTRGFAPDGSPGNAGAYLVQADGRYQRLEKGFVSEPALSADGCRLAYAFERYNDHRSQPHEGGRILVVTNLCTRQAQR